MGHFEGQGDEFKSQAPAEVLFPAFSKEVSSTPLKSVLKPQGHATPKTLEHSDSKDGK